MYDKVDQEKVWNGFRQMQNYLSNVITVFSEASGKYYYDQKKKKYFDATSNMLSATLGHNISEIKDIVMKQYERMDSCSLLHETSDISIKYTMALLACFGGRYNHIFYTNSGSEACDTAIKISQQYFYNKGMDEKRKIISLEGAYHGSTVAATVISCDEYDKRAVMWGAQPVLQVVPPRKRDCPRNSSQDEWVGQCLNEVDSCIQKEESKTIAAILVEPVQLSNGVAVIPDKYFVGLRDICNKYNILFIADEVATGFGHTGRMFACERWGVWPDMIMVAKAITNGTIPLGGVIITSDIYKEFFGTLDSRRELSHGFTTSGNPLGCAAAYATLTYMNKHQVLKNVELLENYFINEMSKLGRYGFVESVDGIGFMFGIKFKKLRLSQYGYVDIGAFIEGTLKRKGLLVYYEGFQKMFVTPPLTSTKEELAYIIEVTNKIFELVHCLLS